MKVAMANKAEQKLSKINQLAKQAAAELGFVLLDLCYGQQGKSKSLTLTIYRKKPPIGFLDCEQMSRSFERLLKLEEVNQADTFGNSYLLEVVSAGIERQLTTSFEYNLFTGEQVRIVAKEKIASWGIEFVGTLLGGDEHVVLVAPAFSLQANKPAKGKSKIAISKQGVLGADGASSELTIGLQQVYRIYLWPGS